MKFKSNFGVQPQADNTVIGYCEGVGIVENEWGNLFYVEIPEELLAIGQIVQTDAITSIDNLPKQKQENIINYVSALKK